MYVFRKKSLPELSVGVTVGEFDWEGPLPRERGVVCIHLESVNEIKHRII